MEPKENQVFQDSQASRVCLESLVSQEQTEFPVFPERLDSMDRQGKMDHPAQMAALDPLDQSGPKGRTDLQGLRVLMENLEIQAPKETWEFKDRRVKMEFRD